MALNMEGMGNNDEEEKVEEINYRGVKAMPFVIGNTRPCFKTGLTIDQLVKPV
ncbi:hypothetical protein HanRHA438_Chr09g0421491 [Helianthus annuus]|nr:hypothetical protein HanRHA438_Chr09g0421491 [Helianthus annuus]